MKNQTIRRGLRLSSLALLAWALGASGSAWAQSKPPADMDAALTRVIASFTDSGVVSAAGNRRAFRVSGEPLDLFRRYMAVYAREQAYCHFSPALIGNLEKHWNAQQRKM